MRPIRVALLRAIDEVSVVLAGNAIDAALRELHPPDIRHQLVVPPPLRLQHMPVLASYLKRLVYYPLVARAIRADVYHITTESYAAIVGLLDPRRCVVTVHHETPAMLREELGVGAGPFYTSHRVSFAGVLRAARIVTTSELMRQHLIERYALAPARVVACPYGHDAAFRPDCAESRAATRAALGLGQEWFILLHVGNCSPRKNVGLILRALAELPPNVHFVQAGGQLDAGQQHIIATQGIAERVHLLGPVAASVLPGLYRASDLFVFPSLVEGFGLPLVEAMASGLPLITSASGVVAEVAGGAAVLVDRHDPAALARVVLRLAELPALREALREAGLRRATQFSWQRHAAALCDLYRAVDRERRGST